MPTQTNSMKISPVIPIALYNTTTAEAEEKLNKKAARQEPVHYATQKSSDTPRQKSSRYYKINILLLALMCMASLPFVERTTYHYKRFRPPQVHTILTLTVLPMNNSNEVWRHTLAQFKSAQCLLEPTNITYPFLNGDVFQSTVQLRPNVFQAFFRSQLLYYFDDVTMVDLHELAMKREIEKPLNIERVTM